MEEFFSTTIKLGRPKVVAKPNAVVLLFSRPIPIAIRVIEGANVYSILKKGTSGESGIGIMTEEGKLEITGMTEKEAEEVYSEIISSMKLAFSK